MENPTFMDIFPLKNLHLHGISQLAMFWPDFVHWSPLWGLSNFHKGSNVVQVAGAGPAPGSQGVMIFYSHLGVS